MHDLRLNELTTKQNATSCSAQQLTSNFQEKLAKKLMKNILDDISM